MANIAQGTTPTIVCTFADADLDLTEAEHIHLTISQYGKKLTKQDDDLTITAKTVSAYLDQRGTLWLNPAKPCEVEVNWTFADGSRGKSNINTVTIDRTLLPEVLP